MCYFYSCVFAACYFNWQCANQQGFVSWLFLGEIVSTAKGVISPYFALRSENTSDEAMKRGKAAANKEDWDSAITEYTKAIRLNPKAAEAYYGRGVAYEGKREYDKAIGDCTEAIRLNPEYVNAYCNRGAAYGNKGEYDNAIADYNEAIHLAPNEANAYCNRGVVYGEKREWNKAVADLSEAIRLNPKYVSAYFQRGCAYLGKGCPSSVFEKSGTGVGGLVGAAAWGFLGLGKADFDRAIADFTEAIRLKPDFAEAYYCRGTAYGMQGEKDKADADLAEARSGSGTSHESQKNGRRCGEVGGRRNAFLGAGRHTNAARDTLGGTPTRNQCHGARVRLLRSAAVGCLWRRGSRCVSGGGIRQEGLGFGRWASSPSFSTPSSPFT